MQDGTNYKNTGIRRIIKAAYYSYKGLIFSFKNEAAFRLEVIAAAFLLPLAVWLDVAAVEKALLIICVFMMLIVELFNTGIEAVVDRIGRERHALAGAAKDVGSAAVLLTIIMGACVWATILWAHFL